MTTILKAAPVDLPNVVDALQRAFYDDPVMEFLFPKESSRRWRMAKLFGVLLTSHHLPLNSVWTTEAHEGAALWAPPGHWMMQPRQLARHAVPWARALGPNLPRALRTLTVIDKAHPKIPHWYLAVLGTAPEHQGQGVGSGLIGPVLERCDEEGVPAYLESSKESNIAFYARHRFEVTGEIRLPGGPTIWPMWREPR